MSEARRCNISEVLVELKHFARDVGELASRGYFDGTFLRVYATYLAPCLFSDLAQVVRKLIGVALGMQWVNFFLTLLIEKSLL